MQKTLNKIQQKHFNNNSTLLGGKLTTANVGIWCLVTLQYFVISLIGEMISKKKNLVVMTQMNNGKTYSFLDKIYYLKIIVYDHKFFSLKS